MDFGVLNKLSSINFFLYFINGCKVIMLAIDFTLSGLSGSVRHTEAKLIIGETLHKQLDQCSLSHATDFIRARMTRNENGQLNAESYAKFPQRVLLPWSTEYDGFRRDVGRHCGSVAYIEGYA